MSARTALAELSASVRGWRGQVRRLFARCGDPHCSHRFRRGPWGRRSNGITLNGNWYCDWACLRHGLEASLERLLQTTPLPPARGRRIPLGLILIQLGRITPEQLRHALMLQQSQPQRRIGQWLQQIGAVREADVTRALAIQWGCPVFPLERDRSYRHCAHLVPRALQQTAHMLPVHLTRDGTLLYAGFVAAVDYALLYGIEQVLACRTVPCIVSETAFRHAQRELERTRPETEWVFDGIGDVEEISRIAIGFAERTRPHQLRLVRVANTIWLRLLGAGDVRDLLFRLPSAIHASEIPF